MTTDQADTERELMRLKLKLFTAVRGLGYQGQWFALAQGVMYGMKQDVANDVARVVDAAYEWANAIEAHALRMKYADPSAASSQGEDQP